jgi:hypothetical protein
LLAPLDDLIEILPQIEPAKQRARLGGALQRATATVKQLSRLPDQVTSLAIILAECRSELPDRTEIERTLSVIVSMARVMAGQPTIEELDNLNQTSLNQLPLHFERVEDKVEAAWRTAVREALGNQGALGAVLTNIPGFQELGRDLTALSERADSLGDKAKSAVWRVAERNRLTTELSAIAGKLEGVGIASNVAKFLVAVAARPVPLSELTDDIYAWIKENNALPLFNVSAGRA